MRRVLLALLLLITALPAPAAEGDPEAIVQRFSDTLVEAMKQGPKLGFQGREGLLGPAVDDTYGMAAMAKLALGPTAAQATPEQMQRLTAAFRDWTVATYASQFKKWGGERIEVGKARPSTGDAQLVPTRIVTTAGQPTQIDYLLRQVDGRWRVVDVLLEGSVSQLAVRRSEFVAVVRRDGIDGLVALLEKRTKALAEG